MTQGDDDDLIFADDHPDSVAPPADPWVVLVVDDDEDVQRITRLVLKDFSFRGRGLSLRSAYSGAEARRLLDELPHVAVALVDVVMETDQAGLQLIEHIRKERGDTLMRVILRTGQAGVAPGKRVIIDYDVNDYAAKSELTAERLFASVVAALRSHEDLRALDASARGLERLVASAGELFEPRSVQALLARVLSLACALAGGAGDGFVCTATRAVGGGDRLRSRMRFPLGRFAQFQETSLIDIDDGRVARLLDEVFEREASVYCDHFLALYLRAENRLEVVVYCEPPGSATPLDRHLLNLFVGQATQALNNVILFDRLSLNQQALVFSLADLASWRDPSAAEHARRIAALVEAIVEKLRADGVFGDALGADLIENLAQASLLHDVGNASLDERILRKQGKLDEDERATMRRHTIAGHALLSDAAVVEQGRSVLAIGAEIARHHHERFDGAGYPDGLREDAIPLSARIVAVADTFDAMISARPQRAALERMAAINWITEQSGAAFDPRVVNAFLRVVDRVSPPADHSR